MEEDFIKATKEWYDYVSQDHHKDRDCHWSLHEIERFSYGEKSKKKMWNIEHDGYILDDIYFSADSRDEVLKEATEYIRNYIKEHK